MSLVKDIKWIGSKAPPMSLKVRSLLAVLIEDRTVLTTCQEQEVVKTGKPTYLRARKQIELDTVVLFVCQPVTHDRPWEVQVELVLESRGVVQMLAFAKGTVRQGMRMSCVLGLPCKE